MDAMNFIYPLLAFTIPSIVVYILYKLLNSAEEQKECLLRELEVHQRRNSELMNLVRHAGSLPNKPHISWLIDAQRIAVKDLSDLVPDCLAQRPEIVWRLHAVDSYMSHIQEGIHPSEPPKRRKDTVYGTLQQHLADADI